MSDYDDPKLSALYRRGRGDEGPSELLDRRIRNAARRQLGLRRQRWVWGLSSAAVLVLSFSVVLQLLYQGDDPRMMMSPPPAPAAPVADERSLPRPAPAPAARAKARERQAQGEAERKRALASSSILKQEAQGVIAQADRRAADQAPRRVEAMPNFVLTEEPSSFASPAPASYPPLPGIPNLPFRLSDLLAFDAELEADPGAGDEWFEVFYRGHRVLRVTVDETWVLFEAWPGAEIFGVKANWALSGEQFSQCHDENAYRACKWSATIKAVFGDAGLDHIRWRQRR